MTPFLSLSRAALCQIYSVAVRVGLIVYGDLDLVSGGNLYDRMLVEHLRGAGHEVEIVSLPNGSYFRHLTQNFKPGLIRRLAASKYDVLVQDELVHPSLFLFNERLRRRVSHPLVAIVHHLRSSEDHPQWQNDWYRRVEKRYLASLDAFVFNSETTRESVESLLQKKTRHVVATPGGDRLPSRLTREDVERRARQDGPLRLLFVGNLIPRKRLHVLLDALGELRDASWTLDVVGSAEMDRSYARLARERITTLGLGSRVTTHGTLAGDALADRYRRSHLLVVPSSYEGFGIVYLEAMAFGLPVIAGATGAADEIVLHETTGFLVRPDDTFSLRKQLERILGDRELLARLGVAAFERFSSFPTWEESMGRAEELLRGLARVVE